VRICFRSVSVSLSRNVLPKIILLANGCGVMGRLHFSFGVAGRR